MTADGDDLPDGDYESIYGAEALEARKLARFRTLEATVQGLLESSARQAERLQAAVERSRRLSEPPREQQHQQDQDNCCL